MPPRRKAAVLKNADVDGPPAKTAKVTDKNEDKLGKKPKTTATRKVGSVDSVKLIWQYESGKKCLPFTDEEIDLINDGLKADETEVKFQQRRVGAVSIDLKKMVKKNDSSGWEVRIRCATTDPTDGGHYVWLWTDSAGEDNLFSPDHMLVLEDAFATKSNVALTDEWADWKVNLKTMEMKHKSASTQKISRVSLESCTTFPKNDSKSDKANGKPAATKSKAGKSKKTKTEAEGPEEPEVKTVRVTGSGKAPVDGECKAKVSTAHVYFEGDEVWDAMLNQTNIQFNNNKYYIIQLLEDNNKKAYSVWTRWGRVGKIAGSALQECGADVEKAKTAFKKKFTDKTKNHWDSRDEFEKVAGKYDLLKMDYSVDDTQTDSFKEKETKKPIALPESKLHSAVRALIELICNVKAMEETVMEMEYDAKKAPLGKLTADQVKAGYAALKVIDELVQKNITGARLVQACNDFYTRIPHNFGMKQPPLITTTDEIRRKITLLEALGDIQIALKMMNEVSDVIEHPVDKHYHSLRCDLNPIDKGSSDFKLINDYLQKTHGKTHNIYQLNLLEVFECKKKDLDFKDIGNRMLLWHGSRLTNWAGILGKGLRIAPPEAPVTGYMFGKGVYFADMSSKSANYCFTSRSNNIGLLLLCEVSLGEINKLLNSDYNADKLPPGKHSVLGAGAVVPDSSTYVKLPDGTLVPVGNGVNSNIKNPGGYTLNYNEYIVYDTKQIRMRYLLKVKFVYK